MPANKLFPGTSPKQLSHLHIFNTLMKTLFIFLTDIFIKALA